MTSQNWSSGRTKNYVAKKEDGSNIFDSNNTQRSTPFGQKMKIVLPVRKIHVISVPESSMDVTTELCV